MMKRYNLILAVAALLATAGCGGMGKTVFVHPEFDFGYLEKVAVVPFENISTDQGAGFRAGRYFTTSLLASDAFEVVEPGEISRALAAQGLVRTAELTEEQLVTLGRELDVQGLFLGTVSESGVYRRGAANVNVVTIVLRLVETESGTTVWSVTNTYDSASFWTSLFGTGQKSLSEVTRKCVDACLGALLD